jgi:Asp-tRNA(Asn)/Glu-tRNA(Gln) amidotransferase C subunit
MIDAQTVTGAKVLINPHSHPVRLRKDRDEHQDEQRDVSHNVAHTDRSLA